MMIHNEPASQKHSTINELNILNGLIEGKLAELNQTITLRKSHGINAALPIILSNRGKILMDKIRTITADIQSRENNMLSNSTRQSQAYAQAVTNTTIITTAIAATTGVSIFAINRGIRKRHLAIQRSLQTQVKQRTEELQTTNNQLMAANDQLKLHDKMQNEFINIASHEMKTPTQAILGYSKLIQRHPEKREEMMRAISRNATRLQRLTSDILDVTRIESQSLKLNIDIFNISDVVSDVVEDYRSEIKESNSDIELLYNPYVDNKNNPLFIEGDRGRITQVISNLVSNAIKFTNKGGRIFVAEEERLIDGRNQIVVSITDSGHGIDPELMPKLFSKFVAKSEKGIGLGLFISKNIVEAHGGKIWARNNDSGANIGATFTFSLPLTGHSKAGTGAATGDAGKQ
jgi:signal transduction histidine kinase